MKMLANKVKQIQLSLKNGNCQQLSCVLSYEENEVSNNLKYTESVHVKSLQQSQTYQ